MNTDTNESLNLEYDKHLDTCALTHAIQDQAYLRHEAAAHLAQVAVDAGYTGGAVVTGIGEFGLDTALPCILWQVAGMWHLYAAYRLADDRWQIVHNAQGKDVQTLRWVVSFTHQARLSDVVVQADV